MRIAISEINSLSELAMFHGLRIMLAEMGLTVEAPLLPFLSSAQPASSPAEAPAAGSVPPAGASASGADGVHSGDLCGECGRYQMPYWREGAKNTARACQNCGHTEERPVYRAGC